jgi:predicted RNase H-like nuclease (RuvC/YqgF family)
MKDAIETSINDLAKSYQEYTTRREALERNKSLIAAELTARRKSLRRLMDECQALGFDPNNIKDELTRQIEIERVKIQTLTSELETAERIIKPMLEEINKG